MTPMQANAATWVQQVTARENTSKQKEFLMAKRTSTRRRAGWRAHLDLWRALTRPTNPRHRKETR